MKGHFVFRAKGTRVLLWLAFVWLFWTTPPMRGEARPLVILAPSITLDVPAQAFLGDTFAFQVTFDNPDTVTGYGPVVDLVIPSSGADGDDGLTFVDATYLGAAVERDVQPVPPTGCVTHPYIRDATGAYIEVCGLTPGDTFVALRLPFGSFTPDQPPATVRVTVTLSNQADVGVPLTVQARGGYQFGETPLDDWCCGDDPSTTLGSWVRASVEPILFTVSKTYNGPEDETATGPNFPRRYTVTVDIAPGQTLDTLTVTDTLPDNMQFVGLVSTSPAAVACTTPSTTAPGGTLSCDFAGVSGSVTMTFEYFIPLRDAGGASVIDPATGDDALSCDNASATATWTPSDPRDPQTTAAQDPAGCEHTLTDKAIAIQKQVEVVGGGDPAPGKVLEYTLTFQISDFFGFGDVVVTDVISDGQRVDASFTPTLQINGNGYALPAAGFDPGNYDVLCNYTGGPGPECTGTDATIPAGSTKLVFRISDEIVARGQDGKLLGGCVPPGSTGGSDPDCAVYNDGPTTGVLVFRTVVQDAFTDDYPSGDPSVDQGDRFDDTVTVQGNVLDVTRPAFPTTGTEADDSSASIQIGYGQLSKTIYAVNDATTFPSPVELKPGDTVTFRIQYTLPTSEFENLRLEDYLPLPVLDATEVTAFSATVCGIPAPGTSCYGPADTYHTLGLAPPTLSTDGTNNRIIWNFGTQDLGPGAQSSTIDLLFTVTVSAEPFADRLHLTNQAHAFEGSTNAGTSAVDAIVEFVLTEPVLVSRKGVVWSSNPNAVYLPSPPGPVTFLDPTNAPRWTGVINSSGLSTTPINSDVTGVDAGDIVTFAIVIENQGSSLKGAFDIQIQDTLPEGFQIPASGLNLQIYYGDGSGPISFTSLAAPTDCTGVWPGDPCGPDGVAGTPDDLFGAGIELVDPVGQGVCQAYDPNTGNNVIVITYDLETTSGITPGDHVNTASLLNYAGTEGGPNHLAQPQTDEATVSVVATAQKQLVGTEITSATNAANQAVIGELVTYTLTLTIPEGTVPNAQVVDTLDPGLAFVSCVNITASEDLSTDLTGGFSAACNPLSDLTVDPGGQQVTFNLGTIQNISRDNLNDETITITYTAVILNVTGNQSGTALNNRAAFSMDDGSGRVTLATASAPEVTVLEPNITTTKTATPTTADAGDTIAFTVTLSSDGDTEAYDVAWSDTLPAGLTYVPGSLTGSCTTHTLSLSDASAPTLEGTVAQLDVGETCTITFQATVDYSVTPGQDLTNTALTTWTSLMGEVSVSRSPYNASGVERTGADGVGGVLNDYASEGTAPVAVRNTAPQKYLMATSEAHTGATASGTPRVAIGEIVRYRLVIQIPEGTSPNFQIRDTLPPGLTFLDDGTAYAFFVSDEGIVSSGVGIVPGITDPDCQVFGSLADGTTPARPAGCPPLADANIGSTDSTATDTDAFASGADVYFKLGTLENYDSDPNGEFVVLEFNVLVDNAGGTDPNDAGDERVNAFDVLIDGVVNATSNNLAVRVVEPVLTVTKTLTTTPVDAGDTVTYTLTIQAASGTQCSGVAGDCATAFDLQLTDTFDPYLTGLSATVSTTQGTTCTGDGGGTTSFAYTSTFTGNAYTLTATCLDPGQSITVTVTGTLANNVPAGYVLTNTADLTWTSLPGSGTAPNDTGSTTPGASGSETGERDGSGGVNDYRDTGTVTLTLAAPSAEKGASPAQAAIGETVTFDIVVTLPEGVTPALQVTDDLPQGMQYVGHQIITAAADSGGLLLQDFSGAFANNPPLFACTGACASGDDVTLDFGDTTVPADNNPDNDAFLVRITAKVLNEAGNQNGTTLTDTVTVSWADGASSGTATVAVVEPELVLTKSTDVATPGYGQTVTYTLTLSHADTSTADAFDVVVTDTLPAGMTYVAGSISAPSGWTADDSAAPTLTWTCVNPCAFPLDSGPLTFTYQATVDYPPPPNPGDVLTNGAQATWTSTDGANPDERTGEDGVGGPLNDYAAQAAASVTVTAPDLVVTKDDGTTTYVPGLSVTYTITITNEGNRDVTGATVSDPKPPEVTTWTWTCTATGGATCSGSGGAITTDFTDTVNVPVGGTITYTVTANIASSARADLVNTVTVSLPEGVLDANPADNTATDTDTAHPQVDLQVTKDDGLTIISAGTTLTYIITVSNQGPSDAFDVTVSDPIPADIARWTWTCTATGGATCSGSGGAITTDFTDTVNVPVGGTITYQVTAEVRETAVDALTNTVTVSPAEGTTETNPENNTASDTDYLAVSEKAFVGTNQPFTSDPQTTIGEMVTYEVTLTVPPGSMTGLTLTDVLDAGLAFVRCEAITASATTLTSSQGSFDTLCAQPQVQAEPPGDSDPVNQGRRVVWDFGTLTNAGAADATLTVRYTVVVLDSLGNQQGTALRNRAVWDWEGGQLVARAPEVAVIEPALTLTKKADPQVVLLGEPITFTLTVKHAAESSTPAYDVVLLDTLPAILKFIPGSLTVDGPAPTVAEYDPTTRTLRVVWDVLDLGEQAKVRFQARLRWEPDDRVVNTAYVAWSSLPGDVTTPQSAYNELSTERFYDPGSEVDVYRTAASVELWVHLPDTGFAPGRTTALPPQPAAIQYQQTNLVLEIPKLGVRIPIVGVPRTDRGWELTWLMGNAGWLEGTTFPTWQGNAGITAHVTLPTGLPGPFAQLHTLQWGDEIRIYYLDQVYVYQVRERRYVGATDIGVLAPTSYPTLTLITCANWDPQTETFRSRLVVQAVLVEVRGP